MQTQTKTARIRQRTELSIAQRQEELDLLTRVLAGDQGAWTLFCQRYENLIVGCVLRVLRRFGVSFSSDDLADFVSDVWVVLLRNDRRKLRLYDPRRGYRLASWLGLMATNCTIDQLRLRSVDTSYLEDMSFSEHLLVESGSPGDGIEHREEMSMARRALSQLTKDEQQFVFHCFHEERSPTELAREMGIAINTVYSRKFKIREKLTRIMASMMTPRPVALAA